MGFHVVSFSLFYVSEFLVRVFIHPTEVQDGIVLGSFFIFSETLGYY